MTVVTGDCREVLAGMAAGSVQLVVTSPPYHGLRAYDCPTAVWGGGDRSTCPDGDHAWGSEWMSCGPVQAQGATSQRLGRANVVDQAMPGRSHGAWCSRCGAWRGELGRERSVDCLGWARGELPKSCQQACFICHPRECFAAVRRVLRDDGLCFVNIGDGYGGTKSQQLVPERFRLAMAADGWIARQRIEWVKKSPMPESVRDRWTNATEPVLMFAKSPRYYADMFAIREESTPGSIARWEGAGPAAPPVKYAGKARCRASSMPSDRTPNGRNPRNYLLLSSEPTRADAEGDAHYAAFPTALVKPLILMGTSEKGACPDCGAAWERIVTRSGGTTGVGWHNHDGDAERGHRAGTAAARGAADFRIETTGWRPRCDGGQPPSANAPCRVLDPFGGTGTVALVADRLGRDGISVEIKPQYARMSDRRLRNDAPLFAASEAAP